MTVRLILVRHGETEWNRTHRFQGRSNVPLNEKGKEQAQALALALKNEDFVAIYSSPLARAIETAKIIKSYHPSALLFEEKGFLEMDLGDFDGMEAKKWALEHPDMLRTWQKSPSRVTMPSGENLKDVQVRAMEAVERITKAYPPGSTLLFSSHNFVNLTILCHATNTPLDQFRKLRQETAAFNILHKNEERLWADVINERSHLEKQNNSS